MRYDVRRITALSLLTSCGLGLFALEMLIPPFPLCPAAKAGLANTVSLFMLCFPAIFNCTDLISVLLIRCLLSGFITGNLQAVLFSLCGGASALVVMLVCRKYISDRPPVMSVCGAVFHNMAQIAVSVFFYGIYSTAYTIPVMFLAGILSGALTGSCTFLMVSNKAVSGFMNNYFRKQ